jgi:membrane protease YdiL (CAAX protease family)
MKRYLDSPTMPYLLYTVVLLFWLARLLFDGALNGLLSSMGSWANTIIKFVFFALPALLFINLNRLQTRGWWVGLAIGVVYFLLRLCSDFIVGDSRQHWQSWTSEIPRLADVVVEEVLFRLALLPLLERQLSFGLANLVQGLMFVGIHLPGWNLQGLPLTVILEFSLGVLVVGLVCGYLNKRTNSVWAGVAFHWCWNFTAGAVVLT